jgi:isopentenyl-diphosphate delta-isomerase
MDVILVDEKDTEIGVMEKIQAHKEAKLHRAFSIFIFNSKKELLLQKRADDKYHSGGLWSNTCCSHPKPGKILIEEAQKRLKEEMGFTTELKEMFSFIYKAFFTNGLVEYEYDHALIGYYDLDPEPDEKEVGEWKWLSLEELKRDRYNRPEKYTYWLRESLDKVIDYVES